MTLTLWDIHLELKRMGEAYRRDADDQLDKDAAAHSSLYTEVAALIETADHCALAAERALNEADS